MRGEPRKNGAKWRISRGHLAQDYGRRHGLSKIGPFESGWFGGAGGWSFLEFVLFFLDDFVENARRHGVAPSARLEFCARMYMMDVFHLAWGISG